MNKPLILAILIATTPVIQSCATAVVGGAATGASIANDRRSIGSVIDDESIELKAIKAIFDDKSLLDSSHINATSVNKVVLITGETPTHDLSQRIEMTIKNIPLVRTIHNQLTIAAPSSMASRGSDTFITSKVKAQLLTAGDLKFSSASQIKVVTENGVVYLMGIVSRHEADIAVEHVRIVNGVQRVVKIFEYIN